MSKWLPPSSWFGLWQAAAWLLICLFGCVVAGEVQADRQADRARYQQALSALQAGQRDRYLQLREALKDYALFPYLLYYDLQDRLATATNTEIADFIAAYDHTPLAARLRKQRLWALAKAQRWDDFLMLYNGSAGTALQCYALQARLQQGDGETPILQEAAALFTAGHSQPDACDPLFERLDARGGITARLLWRRIDNAMANGNTGLAGYLTDWLSSRDKAWVTLWRQVHQDPARYLDDPRLASDGLLQRKIFRHGVRRLAEDDPAEALARWQTGQALYRFSDAQEGSVTRELALRMSYRYLPGAADALQALPTRWRTQDVPVWLARIAIRDGDWQALATALQSLPQAERARPGWQYWLARAEARLEQPNQANQRLAELANEVGYYAYLAADHLDRDYRLPRERSMEIASLQDLPADLCQSYPGLLRAFELYRLDELAAARRELVRLLPKLDGAAKQQVANVAHHLKWHWAAIRALALAGDFDDLERRFPLLHRETVLQAAEAHAAPPAWVYAVMRQESAFMQDVRSPAGAVGLMQLMPGTARFVARQRGQHYPGVYGLLQPKTNIDMGAYYLGRMLERFQGQLVLATAAYNAGPVRVEAWRDETLGLPADRWIDTIPYYETRRYLRRVLTYFMIYQRRLQTEPTRLSAYLGTIKTVSL